MAVVDAVSTDTDLALDIQGLTVEFPTSTGYATVISDVSLSVRRGEIVGIVGESGSGKTVTSLTIMGLLPEGSRVTSGTIDLQGSRLTDMSERQLQAIRGNQVSMIFQNPMSSLNPAFTVGDQIAETVRRHRGLSRKAAADVAVESLEKVGISNARRRLRSYPHEFSGGMRQRVMIAMAISCGPSLLIADEPTTALDVTIQAQVLDLIRSMRDELDMAVIMITHDLGVVADICDYVNVMYSGQIVEQATVEELFADPFHPYTKGLLFSVPNLLATDSVRQSIPGTPPAITDYLPGCRFQPRCANAVDMCRDTKPALVSLLDRHHRCLLGPGHIGEDIR